jgi:hypothetical protein
VAKLGKFPLPLPPPTRGGEINVFFAPPSSWSLPLGRRDKESDLLAIFITEN